MRREENSLQSAEESPPIVLEVRNLTCGYGNTVVLENVSFSVREGEIFFIIGGSGCGKSTLLKHLIGLVPPLAGSILYHGVDFLNCTARQRRELLQQFGVLYQSSALWSSMTIAQNVALPLQEYTNLRKNERDILVAMKLAMVGLGGYEGYYPAELSGGMKKRAGLARALALDPPFLFFDEPSAGLDPITSRKLDTLICETRESLRSTMIVVSHELGSIFSVADRVLFLDADAKGVLAEGTPRELLQNPKHEAVRDFLDDPRLRDYARLQDGGSSDPD